MLSGLTCGSGFTAGGAAGKPLAPAGCTVAAVRPRMAALADAASPLDLKAFSLKAFRVCHSSPSQGSCAGGRGYLMIRNPPSG